MSAPTTTSTILSGHTGTVTGCAFRPDGRLLATTSGDWDKTVRLWDPASGSVVRVIERHADWVHGCAFSPDGEVLVTVSSGWAVRYWDATSGRELPHRRRRQRRHRTTAQGALVNRGRALSPDGSLLAVTAGGWDPVVQVLDAHTGERLRTLEGHTAWVHGCWFRADGRVLATTGGDHTARLWDPHSGRLLRVLEGHQGWVTGGSWNPDGSCFATTSTDRTARLWRVADLP